MNFIALSDAVMVSITKEMLEGKGRPVLNKYPLLASLVPSLEEAHQDVLGNQTVTESKPLEQLQQDETAADAIHDHKARGINGLVVALLELVDDQSKLQPLLDLRNRLFPDGLNFIRASYAAEAGNAELVKGRLTSQDHALLQSIDVLGTPLAHHFDLWMGAAAQLGKLEGDKSAIEKAAAAASARSPRMKARNQWVQTVNALVTNAGLVKDLSDDDRDALFGALLRAGRTTHKSTATTAADPAVTPAVTPAPAAATK